MKIAYIANHRGLANDDEGSIAHAFRLLGHEVVCIQEHKDYDGYDLTVGCDFALIHHHQKSLKSLVRVKCPLVFWFFDLIEHPRDRKVHIEYLTEISKKSLVGFTTDGYGPANFPNVYQLMQGADVRIAGKISHDKQPIDILFAGSYKWSIERREQLKRLRQKYESQFVCFNRQELYRYREDLQRIISNTRIVIAPEYPTRDDYWSNRVYVVLGFGGFLLHPYCRDLAKQYKDGREIVFYRNSQDCLDKIDCYLDQEKVRKDISTNALIRTLWEHTYIHRVKTLLDIVRSKL